MSKEIKVLIVDDDQYGFDILEEILADDCYVLEQALDGVMALEKMESFNPDIVLLDYVMPRMDGLEVCKHIRANPDFKFTKVIMLSSRGESSERVKGYGAGADDYVVKPFDFDEMSAKIRVFSKLKSVEESDRALRQEKEEQASLINQLEHTKDKLMQADKMASIGQLAAGVAHEINNPVGYINSNIGMLKEYMVEIFQMLDAYEKAEDLVSPESEQMKLVMSLKKKLKLDFLRQDIVDLMNESEEGVTRVKDIVQNLKDFSHVDVAEWAWSDLLNGLDSTLNIVNNEIKYKAEVKKEYGELPLVECQMQQVNQVFMNLLVNAAHAIEERGVITIRTGCEGDWVWVEIEDTGKGIAAEDKGKLFEPFFTTKPLGEGTGLGLSVSYGIINTHGGRIDVESEVGKGSKFRIWLPVHHSQGAGNVNEKMYAGQE